MKPSKLIKKENKLNKALNALTKSKNKVTARQAKTVLRTQKIGLMLYYGDFMEALATQNFKLAIQLANNDDMNALKDVL